ncbi:MAG: response regulator [Shimia sp.]|uniref:response regulator n=1 Tax=Shimia sp. TaxID=1954381 RepID=UPI00405801E7
MRILVVDDDPDIQEILSLALQSIGNHNISRAGSAHEAMEIIATAPRPFETLLLDIQMPGVTGIELCQCIRKLPAYRYTPILLVTAMSGKSYIDQAFAVGATDYITKPIDFTDLKLRIGLAEKSAFQTEKLSDAVDQLSSPDLASATATVSLEEAIPIDDVNGVLRVYALENYLKQMNRMEFHHTHMFLVSVTNISTIYARCSGRHFIDQVTDIAEGLSDAFAGMTPFIAYFGQGVYLVALTEHGHTTIEDAKRDVDAAIDNLGMVYPTGAPLFVSLEVVELEKPSLLSLKSSASFVDLIFQELQLAIHATERQFATG